MGTVTSSGAASCIPRAWLGAEAGRAHSPGGTPVAPGAETRTPLRDDGRVYAFPCPLPTPHGNGRKVIEIRTSPRPGGKTPRSRDREKFLETRIDGVSLESRSKSTGNAASRREPGRSRGEQRRRPSRPPARGQTTPPGCEVGVGGAAPQEGRAESGEHDPGPEGLQTERGAGPPGSPLTPLFLLLFGGPPLLPHRGRPPPSAPISFVTSA